ncbi:MAG: hypothetical protein IPF67_19205 [Saprospiraceae bacterium]|nr:hypothetical protein [Candidatus Brachybacter algidus]
MINLNELELISRGGILNYKVSLRDFLQIQFNFSKTKNKLNFIGTIILETNKLPINNSISTNPHRQFPFLRRKNKPYTDGNSKNGGVEKGIVAEDVCIEVRPCPYSEPK